MSAALTVTERQFQATVLALARVLGWRSYHTWRSDHSAAGYPDLTLIRDDVAIFAELKRDGGKPTSAQADWLAALANVRVVEARLWTPSDWDSIVAMLHRK